MSEVTFISHDELIELSPGEYRVTFEGRSAWNADLEIDDERGARLHWYGEKVKQDRHFPLSEDADGNVTCDNKPAWGAMTAIKAR